MPDVAPPIGNGRYRLVSRLGAGGMASVYRAWDQRLKVWRAIKVLHPSFAPNPASRARFEQEASTMAQLRHPNLLAVHDIGDEQGQAFLVMDLAPGGSLADRLGGRPLPARLAVSLMRDVLAGLGHAHAAGVVHRDVKPHNVLLDADGRPLVSDFGIARVGVADLTRTGATIGTLAYMAPEQRGGARHVDARADVYAAGGTLFALLTGRDPHDLFVDGPDTWDGVPDVLVPALRRACRHDPDERWPTAAAFAEALGEIELPAPETFADDASILALPSATLEPPPPSDAGPISAAPADNATMPPVTMPPTEGVTTAPPAPEPPTPVAPPAASRAPVAVLGLGLLLGVAVVAGMAVLGSQPPVPPASAALDEVRVSERDGSADPVVAVAWATDGSLWWTAASGVWRRPPEGSPVRVLGPDRVRADVSVSRGPDGDMFLVDPRAPMRVSPTGEVTPFGAAALDVVATRDGETLAWQDAEGIHVGSLDPGDAGRLVVPTSAVAAALAWSPDGAWLAAFLQGEENHIDVMSRDGSVRWTVARGQVSGRGIIGLTWLADDVVAWVSADGDDTALLSARIDPASGPRAPVERHRWTGADVGSLSYGPGALASVHRRSNFDVYVRDVAPGSDLAQLTSWTGADLVLGWVDEHHLLVRARGDRIAVVDDSGGEVQWSPEGDVWSQAAWCEGVVVGIRRNGSAQDLARIDRPGEVTLLEAGVPEAVRIRANGGRCLLSEARRGGLILDWVAPATGERRPVGTLATSAPIAFPSADGRRVLFVEDGRIHLRDLASSAEDMLGADGVFAASWYPDGEALVVHHHNEAFRFPLDGGSQEALGLISWPILVSPDGTRLATTMNPPNGEVWMLEGL